jgi:hypothetical protein
MKLCIEPKAIERRAARRKNIELQLIKAQGSCQITKHFLVFMPPC